MPKTRCCVRHSVRWASHKKGLYSDKLSDMHYPLIVRRTDTHIIDTRAVRTVIAVLPEFWLLRNVEERDYGIDLLLEIFEEHTGAQKLEHYPTGNLILAQVKGRQEKFGQSVKFYGFPLKTLLYAELFPIPFLLFYVSLDAKQVRFVWLQKYIQVKLDRQQPNWREGSSGPVNIEFPPDNILSPNDQRITQFLLKQRDRETGMQFLAAYEWLRFHLTSVAAGQPEIAQAALGDLRRLREHAKFIGRHRGADSRIDLDTIQQFLHDIDSRKVPFSQVSDDIGEQIEELDLFKQWILSEDDMDQFTAEMSSVPPY